jgi:hypothetical protein
MNYGDFAPNLVRVNRGSGVLVQALSEKYSYVFTAKHNLADQQNTVANPDGSVIAKVSLESCYFSENDDAAIIVIEGISSPSLSIAGNMVNHGGEITLGGFPASPHGEQSSRFLDGKIKFVDERTFQILCEEFPTQDDVMGISGGGIFQKSIGEWVLIGVEFGMAGDTQMNCCNISVFEEIINRNSLAVLRPPFFDNFQKLCAWSFPLTGSFVDSGKRDTLSKILQAYTHAILEGSTITPQALYIELDVKLLVKDTPAHCINHKKLWISWLELLSLSVLIDEKKPEELNMQYIEELQRKRRLLYSNTTADWCGILREIVTATIEGLDDEAILFISNNCTHPPHQYDIDVKRLLPDISRVSSPKFDFTNSKKQSKLSRLVHIDGLHVHCVNLKEFEYSCHDQYETIEKIKNEYASFIKR